MVSELLRPTGRVLSACARLEGEYDIDGVHMCVPARLGIGGIEQIVTLDLNAEELAALRDSAENIKGSVEKLA
jgi:malate dehydrogenase